MLVKLSNPACLRLIFNLAAWSGIAPASPGHKDAKCRALLYTTPAFELLLGAR